MLEPIFAYDPSSDDAEMVNLLNVCFESMTMSHRAATRRNQDDLAFWRDTTAQHGAETVDGPVSAVSLHGAASSLDEQTEPRKKQLRLVDFVDASLSGLVMDTEGVQLYFDTTRSKG